MTDYQPLFDMLDKAGFSEWRERLQKQMTSQLSLNRHGKMPMWQDALSAMPAIKPSHIELKASVAIGAASDLDGVDRDAFIELVKQFHPWRKGPYQLFDIHLDTEWRSDWKWDRVLPHLSPLKGRRVLDVGGGNGYHGWRMLGEDASFVLGIDPTLVFTMQYQLMNHFIGSDRHFVVPIGIEHMPHKLGWFDTVFSMGVLYHRKSPLSHLLELRSCLKPGGELVLETLVIDDKPGMTLMPEERYAKMRNVWFIPSVETLLLWLRRCGFKNARCVDTDITSLDEQRSTEWMTFESLADFLDPDDRSKTIEGYPAPMRAVFIADAPK